MHQRQLQLPLKGTESIFLFGARGVGKTHWLKRHLPDAIYINLLNFNTYQTLSRAPHALSDFIPPGYCGWVVVDEVHHQIEEYGRRFFLTSSSARKLKQKGVNLLAGRALLYLNAPKDRFL